MSRSVLCLVVALISVAPAPAHAQDGPAAWAGTWAAVRNHLEVQLWLVLRVENGELTGSVQPAEVMRGPDPITTASVAGRRLTITVEASDEDEGEAPGRVVLERSADGSSLRVIEGRLEGRRLSRFTLTRRDALWSRVQLELYDLGQENDADTLRGFVMLGDAVSAGLAAGNHPPLVTREQADCALEVVSDAYEVGLSSARTRAVALALARSISGGTICGRNLDELTVEGVGAPESGCGRVVVEDDDGRTTMRTGPSSRAERVGTAPNGHAFSIQEARGRWLRVSHRRGSSWIWAGNVRCLR